MRLYVIVPIIGLYSSQLFASGNCRWSNWSDLTTTILQAAPDWAALRKKQELDRQQWEGAGLSPQARAEAQILAGSPLNKESEMEFRYEWTVERGGKRQARQNMAQSQLDLTTANVEQRKAEILLELAITADRLQQISHEEEVLQETVNTYRALIKQYGERAVLSPEQDVTLAVFRLARDETLLKLGELLVESDGYKSQLSYLTGCSSMTLPRVNAPERSKWPVFAASLNEGSSAMKRQGLARKEQAKAVLQHEQAQAVADLSIGPIARWSRDDGDNQLAFGVSASLPIGGTQPRIALQTAQAAYDLAEAEVSLDEKKRAASYARWFSQYRKSVEVLGQGYAETAVKIKHEKMEQAFLVGRVGAPLIIEAHRQMYEHLVSRHQIEMKAVEALWNLRYLTGRMSQEDL